MKFGILGFTIISFFACNHAPEQGSQQESNVADLEGVYEYHKGRDSIRLELNAKGDSLIGSLDYAFYEKDRNSGVFRAVVQDSILRGKYTFNSEGQSSTREIVFGIVPNGLIEGFGEVKEIDGIMVFNDIKSLQYNHGMLLTKKTN